MMSGRLLRHMPRLSYSEYKEPNSDEYIFCEECADFVFEYCSIHGRLQVISDDKVTNKPDYQSQVPRAALTIPSMCLHLSESTIPGAGLGVFTTRIVPRGVRFGPYCGQRKEQVDSMYSWQIYGRDGRRSHVVDAADSESSNWMRYVNCSRHSCEQNLVAFQFRTQIYYRTIKEIPPSTELLVFYGSEFANKLNINLRLYNSPAGISAVERKVSLGAQNLTDKPTSKPKENIETDAAPKDASHDFENFVEESQTESVIALPKRKLIKRKNDTKLHGKNKNKTPSIADTDLTDHNHNLSLVCKHNGKILYECGICHSAFTQHGKRCQKCQKGNKTQNNEKSYQCNTCQKTYTRRSTLKLHIRTHTGERPYKCSTCQKRFTQSYKLKRHILIHTGEKPYSCVTCRRRFTEKSKLKIHIRIHTGEKPYKCGVCQKCFTHNSSLKDHMRIHTGEKPYKCDTCQKMYRYHNNLKDHMRTHNFEKLYKCDRCQKEFTNKANWKIHVRAYSGVKPYKCKTCQRTFSNQKSWKRHIRTHTGEKPYSCETCLRAFAHRNSLNRHILTHTGEKPYQCDTCPRTFTHYNTYKSHIVRTHRDQQPFICDTCQRSYIHRKSFEMHVHSHMRIIPLAEM